MSGYLGLQHQLASPHRCRGPWCACPRRWVRRQRRALQLQRRIAQANGLPWTQGPGLVFCEPLTLDICPVAATQVDDLDGRAADLDEGVMP